VLVELFDGAGTKPHRLHGDAFGCRSMVAGNAAVQERGWQTAMDRGYAKITVQSGSGVFAFASVIDNITTTRRR